MSSKPKPGQKPGQPAEQVETRPLAAILPYERNARTHSDEQIDLLANLMLRYGVDQPIVVDEAGVILKGHGRRLAAIKAGFKTFPVVIQRGLSDDDKRALRIADNQVALLAGWDQELMRLEVGELKLHGFDLPLLGFGDAELASFLDSNPGLTDPDDVPEPPAEPVSRSGDLWMLGRHRLMCGDATNADDVAKVLGEAKPHLMVTDPPYGVDYDPAWRNDPKLKGVIHGGGRSDGPVQNDDRGEWDEAWALFSGDVVYCWCGQIQVISMGLQIQNAGFDIRNLIVWGKGNHVLTRGHYHSQQETCWYAVRKGRTAHWAGDRSQTTLWSVHRTVSNDTGHSTQKPIECMKRPIENNSSPGQPVYDPFVGSGTTIIAAEMTGRACYAIEIPPAYVDVAIERWQNFTGEQATLDGQPFLQVKAERLVAKPKREPAEAAIA